MNILGLKVTSHDTGAALISGKKVIAIAEERLNRIKHSTNMFPSLSIDYCLREFGITHEDIDIVVVDQIGNTPSEAIFKKNTAGKFSRAKIYTINHHDSHAANAFFCSPFESSAVLIVDGVGQRLAGHLGMSGVETETMYRGDGNSLTMIQKTTHIRRNLLFPYTVGIGKLYTLITEGFLSFGHYNEGKMMGLAPYGDDRVLKKHPLSEWVREVNGHVVCNPHIVFDGYEQFVSKKKILKPFRRFLSKLFEKIGLALVEFSAVRKNEFFIAPNIFKPIRLEQSARKTSHPLPDGYYAGVAYAVQKVLEEAMVMMGKRLKAITGQKYLCVSGGVGLNIDANKRFLDDVGFEHIFVQPAASDTGIALGCALYGAHMIAKLPRFWEMKSASLGKTYSVSRIEKALHEVKDKISFHKSEDVFSETAKYISEKKIIGWYQGGSEYGPRALGNRSILVDARPADMADIVNERVKHREKWRPFAASILAEEQSNWFDLTEPSPFMLLAAQVKADKKGMVPSIVHVDGTCRIQSVTREANESYYKLLSAFKNLTGVPLVLNTSFNVAGEPIVETPEDALRCFLGTNFDYLILGEYVVTKR